MVEVKMGTKIGFIGLGKMGLPMADNILKAGFSLCVYNRTKDKAAALLGLGAKWMQTPAELATECDIVITMVSNDAALNEIVNGPNGLMSASTLPKIHVTMSTVSPAIADALEKQHKERGSTFLAAPVSGRPERAKAGSLWIFLAGDPGLKEEACAVLKTMSVKIYDLGDQARQAMVYKLCNNFMIIGFLELFSEASTLLEKEGISVDKAVEILGTSLFDSPVFHSYEKMWCTRDFASGGFALDLGLKDMRLLHTVADENQTPMPILDHVHEKLLASMNRGRAQFDWSSIMLLTRELAGLKN